jgi:hypothetical protein
MKPVEVGEHADWLAGLLSIAELKCSRNNCFPIIDKSR